MAEYKSILLGDYFENLIDSQIQSGRFSSASEVSRAALRLFEQEEKLKGKLIEELGTGEKSGFVQDFDRAKFLKDLHAKHLTN